MGASTRENLFSANFVDAIGGWRTAANLGATRAHRLLVIAYEYVKYQWYGQCHRSKAEDFTSNSGATSHSTMIALLLKRMAWQRYTCQHVGSEGYGAEASHCLFTVRMC